MEYYSAIKKNEIVLFEGKMNRIGEYHAKQSKPGSERQRSHVFSHV
jgi:hypothetical protein